MINYILINFKLFQIYKIVNKYLIIYFGSGRVKKNVNLNLKRSGQYKKIKKRSGQYKKIK
jgi:hypothetical protein